MNKIIHISSDQNSNIDVQIEEINTIQEQKISIWNSYDNEFRGVLDKKYGIKLPEIPEYASNNGHMYYLICQDSEQRSQLISDLKEKGILAVFHYLSLHKSPYYQNKYIGNDLALSDHYTDCLVRLPLYFELSQEEQESIINSVLNINLSIS